MKRRHFLLAAGATGVAPAARSQSPSGPRIVYLSGRSAATNSHLLGSLPRRLQERGLCRRPKRHHRHTLGERPLRRCGENGGRGRGDQARPDRRRRRQSGRRRGQAGDLDHSRRVRRRRRSGEDRAGRQPQSAERQPDRHDLVGQRARRQAARPAARHAAPGAHRGRADEPRQPGLRGAPAAHPGDRRRPRPRDQAPDRSRQLGDRARLPVAAARARSMPWPSAPMPS